MFGENLSLVSSLTLPLFLALELVMQRTFLINIFKSFYLFFLRECGGGTEGQGTGLREREKDNHKQALCLA